MKLFSEFAYWRATRADARGDHRRSVFWTDVECWLLGYGTWRELRAMSARRERVARPFVGMPVIEGPQL